MTAPEMPRYKSHKIIEAAQIVSLGPQDGGPLFVKVEWGDGETATRTVVEVPEDFFARGVPALNDYLVKYEDGYLSWSPAKAFEEGYTRIT